LLNAAESHFFQASQTGWQKTMVLCGHLMQYLTLYIKLPDVSCWNLFITTMSENVEHNGKAPIQDQVKDACNPSLQLTEPRPHFVLDCSAKDVEQGIATHDPDETADSEEEASDSDKLFYKDIEQDEDHWPDGMSSPVPPVKAKSVAQGDSYLVAEQDSIEKLQGKTHTMSMTDAKQCPDHYRRAQIVLNTFDIGALAAVVEVLYEFRKGGEPTPTSHSTYEEQLLEEARTFLGHIGCPVDAETAKRVARIALTVHCAAEVAFNADDAADGDIDTAIEFLLDEAHTRAGDNSEEIAGTSLISQQPEGSTPQESSLETRILWDESLAPEHGEGETAVSADTQKESGPIVAHRRERGVSDAASPQSLHQDVSLDPRVAGQDFLALYVSKAEHTKPNGSEPSPQHVHQGGSPFSCPVAPEEPEDPAQNVDDGPPSLIMPLPAASCATENIIALSDGYINRELQASHVPPTTASQTERQENIIEDVVNARTPSPEDGNWLPPSPPAQQERCTQEHELSDTEKHTQQLYRPQVPTLRWHDPVIPTGGGRFDVRLPCKSSDESRQHLPLLCWPATLAIKNDQLFLIDAKSENEDAESSTQAPRRMRVHVSGDMSTPTAAPFIAAAPGSNPPFRLARCRLSALHLLMLKTFVDDDFWNAVGQFRDEVRAEECRVTSDIARYEERRMLLRGLAATTAGQIESILGQAEEMVRNSEALQVMLAEAGRLLGLIDGKEGKLGRIACLGDENTKESFWVVER